MMGEKNICWTERILRVDLSSEKICEEPTLKYSERFLGGFGIGMKIMWDEVLPWIQPFDPENRLVFMTGPLTGTMAPTSGRFEIVTKAPGVNPFMPTRSGIGGYWGALLKFAGYDGLIVQGKAERPSLLEIFDEKVRITDADDLWGLDTFETQRVIEKKYGKGVKTLCIGPAGENRVHFSAILSESGYAAAKTGVGAVMGSKNLKAIVVKGSHGLKVAHPDEFMKNVKEANRLLRHHPMREWASQGPIEGQWKFVKQHRIKYASCFCCPVACRSFVRMPGFDGGEVMCLSQYYLNLGAIDDRAAWAGKVLSDKLGICQYTLYDLIGWMREEYEAGNITEEETGIPWSKSGTIEFIEKFLHMVAYRQGFGDLIGNGPMGVYQHFGEKVRDSYEAHFPARSQAEHYSVRAYPLVLMQWAMGNRDPLSGAHDWTVLVYWSGMNWPRDQKGALSSEQVKAIGKEVYGSEASVEAFTYADKAKVATIVQNMSSLKNSLILCDWSCFPILTSINNPPDFKGNPDIERKLYCSAAGTNLSADEWSKIGERMFNLERCVMVREGRRKKDDTVAGFHFRVPETEVPPWEKPQDVPPVADKGRFETMRDEFYRLRGWDPDTGVPTESKLRELELHDVADELIKEQVIVKNK
jgi:aldehyde:ferredoxin oxidoreductase